MKPATASSSEMSIADRIRAHAAATYIDPARRCGEREVVIRAGDVHRAMGLTSAMPSVCSALGGRRFEEAAEVALIDRKGPRNGANVYFTFSLNPAAAPMTRPKHPQPVKLSAPEAQAASQRQTGGAPFRRSMPRCDVDLADALVLVSCVKSKQARAAPARELYTSAWFTKVRALVEAQNANWFILSALHGLVAPDQEIAPYEKTLKTMGVAERRAWAEKVLEQLEPHLKGRRRVVFFAGEPYREFLVAPLQARGIAVEVPMEGLSIGRQLAWLTEAG